MFAYIRRALLRMGRVEARARLDLARTSHVDANASPIRTGSAPRRSSARLIRASAALAQGLLLRI